MINIAGYQIIEKLFESDYSLLYRARRAESDQPVILKVLKDDHPAPERIAWFEREFEVIRTLNPAAGPEQALPGVAAAYSLEHGPQYWVMVLEDFGGDSLVRLGLAGQLDLANFLTLAGNIAGILDQLHRRGIIHKDINPANILLNPATGQIKLTNFGIATTLARESSTFRSPAMLEGTPAYISPEQSGRMNRNIDYRTDFYSLGVTFYELLTGQLPFTGRDTLELVHGHIARQPYPPHQLKPDLPPILGEIVLKLMSKNAEDRYQSTYGLQVDLDTCLRQWQAAGNIESFPLGRYDISDRFQIPQKLYGREQELETLLSGLEPGIDAAKNSEFKIEGIPQSKIQNQKSKMVLVSGPAGIGKSVLVQEVYRPLTRRRGYFVAGKFDQLQRNTPYDSLIQAFRALARHVLTESQANIAVWREKLLAVLGGSGQVLTGVIPELELIIGPQPDMPVLAPTEAQNRFNLVFQNFIRVFAGPEHPLAVFLDDLQWADRASLKLLETLVTAVESGSLLIIGAYRDDEVGPAHPLLLALEAIEQAGVAIRRISLDPLPLPAITSLTADTLACPPDRAKSLAELTLTKTGGNPFFVLEFLKSLHTEGLLTFIPPDSIYDKSKIQNPKSKIGWRWDLDQIQAHAITANVVELLAGQAQKLPEAARRVLSLAACIGNRFDLTMLAIAAEKSPAETAAYLWPAIAAGLILPLSDAYKLAGVREQVGVRMPVAGSHEPQAEPLPTAKSPSPIPTVSYKFAHDRVQQAVYSLIPAAEQQARHRQIGQLLWRSFSVEERETHIFDLVHQLNLGRLLCETQTERDELAALNLLAGQKAKAAAAYQPAFTYFKVGLELLQGVADSSSKLKIQNPKPVLNEAEVSKIGSTTAWQRCYDLALALYLVAAEAAYLLGEFAEMERLAGIVLAQAKTVLDRVKVYEIKVQACNAQNQLLEAVQTGLQALNLLGLDLPEQPTAEDIAAALQETQALVAKKRPESLLDLPRMTDPLQLAAMRLMSALFAPAYSAVSGVVPLLVCRQINLSLRYGNAADSAFSYSSYGVILCANGDLDQGYQFGQLGLRLLEQIQAHELKAKLYLIVAGIIRHWKEPVQAILPALREAYQSGLDSGDLAYAADGAASYCIALFLAGQELGKVDREMDSYSEAIARLKQERILHWLQIYWQAVLILQNPAERPSPRDGEPFRLTGRVYDEEHMLPRHLAANDISSLFNLNFSKLVLAYLFHHFPQAVEYAAEAKEHSANAATTFCASPLYFYDSLAHLAVWFETSQPEQEQLLARLTANQVKMKKWAEHNPANCLHKFYLVEAEHARVLGRRGQAWEYYQQAITLARQYEYLPEEALANELAGRFHLENDQPQVARVYLRQAHYIYQRWGALAKVRDLEERYPEWLTRPDRAGQLPQDTTPEQDLTTLTGPAQIAAVGLDLMSVIKAAQVISGEIAGGLDNLLTRMMKLIIENAGAQRGLLILEQTTVGEPPAWVIAAEVRADRDEAQVLPSRQLILLETAGGDSQTPLLPVSIVNYVLRTKENLVINDAAQAEEFAHAAYMTKMQPKSILCLPLLNQAKVSGVLYLENNLSTGVFTSERLAVLNLLSSQMAISLDNARLYADLSNSEALLRDLNLELEQRVAERTAQLKAAQAELIHKERLATLGQLTATVSHELRNPLGTLRASAYSVAAKTRNKDLGVEKALDRIERSITRCDHIIDELLDYTRIRDLQLERTPFDGWLERVLNDQVLPEGIVLRRELNFGAEVALDRERFHRVIINIFDNACQAMHEAPKPAGGPHVLTVQTEVIENWLQVTFIDTGIGISSEVMPHIFEPLYSTKGFGVGLGLPIVKQIVQQHNGEVEATGAVGQGTRVVLRLPLS